MVRIPHTSALLKAFRVDASRALTVWKANGLAVARYNLAYVLARGCYNATSHYAVVATHIRYVVAEIRRVLIGAGSVGVQVDCPEHVMDGTRNLIGSCKQVFLEKPGSCAVISKKMLQMMKAA
jgi:hypothetical protein